MSAVNPIRIVSPFRFPPSLSSKHEEELRKRGIAKEFAMASGVRTAADNELRDLNFQASLPHDERSKGLQGICFPYVDLELNAEASWRIKPDTTFTMSDGSHPKYLSRIGDKVRAYFPHTTTLELLADPKVNVVITEGEYKALAIAEALQQTETKRKFAVIGLQGVNGGWHREKHVVSTPDGGHEKKPIGPPKLIGDLQSIDWKKRTVYICFDSDVASKKHASSFKQSKHAGAWGAEFVLTELLRAQGAEVRIVEIPDNDNGEKVGADDYIAKNGQYAFLKLLWNNWTAQRDVDKVLYRPNPEALVFVEARELVKVKPPRPVFVIDKLLPEGGTMIVAAAPKVGKSGIALNAAKAIATGEDFLGVFPVRKGRVVYVQTEIPAWAMAERLKLMGDLPEGMLIHTPGKFKINLWEEDGYQKKRETGNRERVAGLIEALRAQAASLVIFDPLRHFHSLNELNVDHVAHLFEVFRAIGRAVPCGVMIVHHHRKTARSQVEYEGAEDMSGSGALFGEADSILSIYRKVRRSDDTRRYKMVFDLRHAETPEPMELFRMGGGNAMLWTAEPWADTPSAPTDESLDRILALLSKDRMARYKAGAIGDMVGIRHTALYGKLNKLVRSGQIKKDGNLYYVSEEE
jgi:hypothetical protein